MFERQRSGSVLCPSCGSLVGVGDDQCLICGRKRPGLWGFAGILRGLVGDDSGFVTLVLWACGALYLASLVVGREGSASGGGLTWFSFLSPGGESLFLFGASGYLPFFGYGRWWTPLSAGWLHGGLLHIVFNMMALRDLGPLTVHLYGVARTAIIYTVASVVGFLASSLAGEYLHFLPFLHGARMTIGASASLFGLIGALLYYGRRGGSIALRQAATRWAVSGLVFGFVVPGIDNWAHIGGLAGGYLTSRWLDPLLPERGNHVIAALACLLLSAAAIAASLVVGLPPGR
jgi:rhomboid protease GluP